MQGYYAPSGYYPVPQPVIAPPTLTPQQLAQIPYVSHYRNTPQFEAPRQLPQQSIPYSNYQRHRYDTYVPPPPEPASQPRRSHSLAVPNPKAKPLKSALKRSNHVRSESLGEPISRTSSRAPSEPQQRERASSRPRANSNPSPFVPDHAFITFPSSSEVRIENIAFPYTVDDIRQNLLPGWPHGVASELHRDNIWRATFNGAPWASAGADLIIARRMIGTIWRVMSSHGYTYLTTTSTATPPAKFIFLKTEQQTAPYLFTVSVSQSGSKYSFLDAPLPLVYTLGANLRRMFRHRIDYDQATEDGIFVIEVRKNSSAPDVDRSVLSAYILGYFNSVGFKLDGSIPLGKAAPLGFGSKKELWVFKGTQTRPESASGHNSVNGPNSAHGHGEF